eukprot:scaffold90748_cov63-Phaeocystis_antarctica.AAC.1
MSAEGSEVTDAATGGAIDRRARARAATAAATDVPSSSPSPDGSLRPAVSGSAGGEVRLSHGSAAVASRSWAALVACCRRIRPNSWNSAGRSPTSFGSAGFDKSM